MDDLTYTIHEEIFTRFPGYMRGVVLARDVTNASSPEGVIELLREAENLVRERLSLVALIEDVHIEPWREAFRDFGAKPGEYRPSIEAMVRRVLRRELLPGINALVDIGNIISLRHLLPVGSHAIDVLEESIELRLASGEESFIAFGSEQVEHPQPGEVIFAEGEHVLTRRWVWRQSARTLTQLDTQAVEFNIDALPPISFDQVECACRQLCELVARCCGGSLRYEILRLGNPRMELDF